MTSSRSGFLLSPSGAVPAGAPSMHADTDRAPKSKVSSQRDQVRATATADSFEVGRLEAGESGVGLVLPNPRSRAT